MTYSQQVPPDCENDGVPTLHDQIADTAIYKSEEKTVEELDFKPDKHDLGLSK